MCQGVETYLVITLMIYYQILVFMNYNRFEISPIKVFSSSVSVFPFIAVVLLVFFLMNMASGRAPRGHGKDKRNSVFTKSAKRKKEEN